MPQQQLHAVAPWGEPAAAPAPVEPAGVRGASAAGNGSAGGGGDVCFFSGPLLAAQLGVALGRRWGVWETGRDEARWGCL